MKYIRKINTIYRKYLSVLIKIVIKLDQVRNGSVREWPNISYFFNYNIIINWSHIFGINITTYY